MELIAAILVAGPLGYLGGTRRRGLALYLTLWAVIFPIQTVVAVSSTDRNDPLYWVFNAVILAVGIGLNTVGVRLRERRGRVAASTPGP